MPIYKVDGVKKDGQQKYRVRINYTTATGEKKQMTKIAYGSSEAKRLELELLQASRSTTIPACSMTFQALYEEYIRQKQHTVRESTLDKEKRIIARHILPFFGDMKLSKINLQVLQRWKLEIEEKGLSLVMRRNIYQPLNSILKYAVNMDYLPRNPLTKLGRFRDAYAEKPEMDYYTPEEWKKFKASAGAEAEATGFYEWNYYVFFHIAFYAGLRKGEIHALKWSDIDGDLLKVRRSINQKLKGGDRETPPKNKSSVRDIQIPAPLMKVLHDHKSRYATHALGFNDDWYICGGTAPLRDSSVSNRNIRYATAAGLKTIRIHDFRHSHASLLANEGINIQEIARRLGHSKIEITWNTYSHLYPREEERAVKILNGIE